MKMFGVLIHLGPYLSGGWKWAFFLVMTVHTVMDVSKFLKRRPRENLNDKSHVEKVLVK